MHCDAGIRTALGLASLVLLLTAFAAEAVPDKGGLELSVEYANSLESKLAASAQAADLRIYDQLTYGQGEFMGIEGKHYKILVLLLDKKGRHRVRLLDLPAADLANSEWKGPLYFTGVLSKAEKTLLGYFEYTVTYALVSSKSQRNYSAEARLFVSHTEELKAKAAIRARSRPPAAMPASAPTPVSAEKAEVAQGQTPAGSLGPNTESGDAKSSAGPSGRPARLKRGREGAQASPSVDDAVSGLPLAQAKDDRDVVIYRPKGGAKPSVRTRVPDSGPAIEADRAADSAVGPRAPLASLKEVDGMVLIPEGYVTLGSEEITDREKPLHRVFVQPFYLDKYEVTNLDYQQFCAASGHKRPVYWKGRTCPKEMEKLPVVWVTWQNAMTYARWARKRLPSEAEWERAAKGPNGYLYAYGNSYDAQRANTSGGKVMPVGLYPANDFGLHDMTGNVSEWTSSLFFPYPYKRDDGREDPKATGLRVLRGGGNFGNEGVSRCLVRTDGLPEYGTPSDGFRCAHDAN